MNAFFDTKQCGRGLLKLLALLLLALGTVHLSADAQAAEVRAYVEPGTTRPNQVVNYIISIQGGQLNSPPQLELPLQLGQASNMSSFQQHSFTNGVRSSSLRLSWGIAASEPGEFIIPPQTLVVDGQPVTTNEVKLVVQQGGRAGDEESLPDGQAPILEIELGKTEIYQGEVVPLLCNLFVPRSIQLRRFGGLMEIEKSDFAVARFPQNADTTMTVIDGVGYLVTTYRSTLSSLKTGELTLGPASIELLVEVPVDAARARQMMPPGFPPGFFAVPTEPRKLNVKSKSVKVKVLPLPAEGRPASFSGAVGDFRLSATATPTELRVGDPVSVELMIEGSGNFDALTTPEMVSPQGWKLYPAKRYSIEGQLDQNQTPTVERKIGFTQVMVPEAVHNSVPSFELSFFNPVEKKYVHLRTEPIPLAMTPLPAEAPGESSGSAGAGTAAAALPVQPLVSDPQADITDILVRPADQPRWASVRPALLVNNRWFWSAQAVPVALFALACFLAAARRRREARDSGRAGELRAAWEAVQESGVEDREFLRRAAQLVYISGAAASRDEGHVKTILDRYETVRFSAASTPAKLEAAERKQILEALSPVVQKAISAGVKILVLGGLLGAGALQAAEAPPGPGADEVYKNAVTELGKGNFMRAQSMAEGLLKKNPPAISPEVFEIIGHSRYRQGDLGRAALNYQRARLFPHASAELKQNLRHLHDRTRYLSFESLPPLREWSLWLTANQWVALAAGGVWVVFLALAWRVVSSRGRASATPIVLAVLGLLVASPAAAMAAIRPLGAERVKDIAIVTSADVSAYTSATVTAGTVISLPPGSQVRVLETRAAWCYVEIPDTQEKLRGWVEAGSITPLWEWDTSLLP